MRRWFPMNSFKNELPRKQGLKGKLNYFVIATLFAVTAVLSLTSSLNAQQSTTFTLSNINTTGTGTSSTSGAGAYTVNGAGGGVGGINDSFTYLKIQTSGNVEMMTKITSQQNTTNYATAGLMIRESLASDSAQASVSVSPLNGVNFSTRALKILPTDHPDSTTTLGPSVAAPIWIKIVKSGDTISGFSSTTGYSGWSLIGQTNLKLTSSFYVGFAVASNLDPTLSTAQFTNSVFMRDVPQRSADLLLWLRADAGIVESGSNISSWNDQSTFANNAAQTVATNQPQILTNQINGLPAVDFAKLASTNRWLQVPSGFSDFTNGASIFVVAKPPVTGLTDARLLDLGNAASSNNIQLYQPTVAGLTFRTYNSSTQKSVTTASGMTSAYNLAEVVHNGDFAATLYINGAAVATQAGSSNMFNITNIERTGNFIGKAFGSTNFFEGQIAEVIVFKKGLSDAERKAVESYIFYKYGVGSSPSPPAPIISVQSCNDSGCTLIPATGSYSSTQTVEIHTDPIFTQIRYTVDGSTPTTSSTLYSSPVSVSSTTTLKAISVAGAAVSTVTTAVIDIDANAVDVTRLGLDLWLKANAGVDTAGGGVTAWYDLSGYGLNATQSLSTDRPTVTSSAIGTKPAITFNGITQNLQLPKGFSNLVNGASVFVVASPTIGSGNRNIFDFSDQGNGKIEQYISGVNDFRFQVWNPTQTNVQGFSSLAPHLYEVIQSGTTATVYTDGTNKTVNSAMLNISNIARSSNFLGKSFGGSNFV
jgi:hypothetical protein